MATLPADFAEKYLIGGVITPFAAPGGGDRVRRHNAVRNVVCSAVSEFTSVTPELEKPGLLLPPKPPDPGDPVPAWPRTSSCPALPVAAPLMYGSPVASQVFLRPGISRSRPSSAPPLLSTSNPSVADVFHEVESRKNSFQNTAAQVASLGASFRPLVLEACGGGWSHALRETIAWVSTESRSLRGLAGSTPSDISLRIAQRISCTLHMENARAILRRSPGSSHDSFDMTGDLVSGSAW